MLDSRQLQVFMAIWEKRNLSLAAEAVFLTQPTVSAHLRALEEQLNVRLFNRTPKEVVPTAAGELLYPYIQRMVRLNRQAEEALSRFAGEEAGLLEIGASNIPGQYVLPRLLGAFRKERPGVDIRLRVADTARVSAEVLEGRIELGLVGARISRKRLIFQEWFHDELVFVTDPEHEFRKRSSINFHQMISQPFIMRERGSGTRLTIEKALSDRGISTDRLNIIMEMGSTEAVRQGVKAGVGCAIISSRAVRDDVDCGLLHTPRVTDFELKRKFYLVMCSGRTLSPVTETFRKFISANS